MLTQLTITESILPSTFGKTDFSCCVSRKTERREGYFGAGRDNNDEVRDENGMGGITARLYSLKL